MNDNDERNGTQVPKAYFIAEVEVHDPALFEEYRKQVPASIESFGGRYIVRGGAAEGREGEWRPKRIVVVEFPSIESARKWHDSDNYAPIRAMREASAVSSAILVEGV